MSFCVRRDQNAWDIIFFDPPYKDDYLKTLELHRLECRKLLTEDGLLIVEHHHKNVLARNSRQPPPHTRFETGRLRLSASIKSITTKTLITDYHLFVPLCCLFVAYVDLRY